MKNVNYLLILLSFIFLLVACEENGIFFPTKSTSQNAGLFEVTIDGVNFSTENVNFTSDGVDLYINAIKPETNESFTLQVEDFNVSSFSFEGENNVASYKKNNTLSTDIWTTSKATSSRGNIEFTTIDFVDNRVTGTFNFIGKNISTGSSSAFTNGVFVNVPKSGIIVNNESFSAKIDGVEYEEISLFANLVTVGNNEQIMINANKSLSETISISVPSDISVGQYDFGSFTSQTEATAQYIIDGSIYVADGKIIISNHDKISKIISGTFQFEASLLSSTTTNFSITEGQFNVSY